MASCKRWQWVAAALLIGSVRLGAQAPDKVRPAAKPVSTVQIPVMGVAGVHYTALTPIAEPLGLKVSWLDGAAGVKVAADKKYLVLYEGELLTGSSSGLLCLANPPLRRKGLLYVPTEIFMAQLGGEIVKEPEAWLLRFGAREFRVPLPDVPSYPRWVDKLVADLDDPRVPITEFRNVLVLKDDLRVVLDAYNTVSGPVKTALLALAESKLAKPLAHLPLVGELLSTAQLAAGATAEALAAGERLAAWDESLNVPVRRALVVCNRVSQHPGVELATAGLKDLKAAGPALDKQMAVWDKHAITLQQAGLALSLLEAKLKSFQGSEYAKKLGVTLVVTPAVQANQRLLLYTQSRRRNAELQKDYFARLIATIEAAPAEPAK